MESLAVLARPVADLLLQRRETLAVAESSTGGLIAAALLAVPGASAWFRGGGIVYTQAAREGLLALGAREMKGIRPASEPYAALLARTIRRRLDAGWGLAESGATGPSGNRYGDAPGHTCLAVDGPAGRTLTLETGSAAREENMWAFARAALELLAAALRDAP
jgi:PncC family amidohydrolase